MHPDSSPEFDSSSSCSAASPGGDTPGRSQHPPDSLSSSEDITEDTQTGVADSFVPTVTAVSSSPGLRWMVQPTVTSPTPCRAKTHTRGAARLSTSPPGAKKVQPGGRKGQKQQPSREEEEKRRIRRERNKIAAAKCRNRRRELIDTLQAETDQLEDEKAALEAEISDLLREKERLEHVLSTHKSPCKVPRDDDDEGGRREDNEEEEEEGEGDEDDANTMLQDPPSSPQLLSILENAKTTESGSSLGDGPAVQDVDSVPCIPAAAISGNSNILLCSSVEEEPLRDLRGDDLDDLVPCLEMAAMAEAAVSVPDIDLSGPFGLTDWETLYNSVSNDLGPLSTPVMSSSPTCSNPRPVFSFNCSEIDALDEDCESLKGSMGSSDFIKDNSLNSPTLLAL